MAYTITTLSDVTSGDYIYPVTKLEAVYDSDGNSMSTKISNLSTKSTVTDATLLATNWTGDSKPYTYTLTVSGVTSTSNQEILPSLDITLKQLMALQSANLQDGGQSSNTIVLKCFGANPTIDIPIRVVVRGDS